MRKLLGLGFILGLILFNSYGYTLSKNQWDSLLLVPNPEYKNWHVRTFIGNHGKRIGLAMADDKTIWTSMSVYYDDKYKPPKGRISFSVPYQKGHIKLDEPVTIKVDKNDIIKLDPFVEETCRYRTYCIVSYPFIKELFEQMKTGIKMEVSFSKTMVFEYSLLGFTRAFNHAQRF